MSTRSTWSALPPGVRATIESHTGEVRSTRNATGGRSHTVATIVTTEGGSSLLVRGADPTNDRSARRLRREILVAPLVARMSPRLHHISIDGWDVVVSEFVDGPPISLGPGSKHLGHVVNFLVAVRRIHPPATLGLPQYADRWADVLHPGDLGLLTGHDLLHTDLRPGHMLLSAPDGRAPHLRVMGWGGAAAGPAWIDVATTGMQLLRAGHGFPSARQWLSLFPAWRAASYAARRAFMVGAVHDARVVDDREQAEHWVSLLMD